MGGVCMMRFFEATGIKDGKVVGNTLYKYEIEKNIYNTDGRIENVIGYHKKVSKMSPQLFHRLRCGGASEDAIKQFM